MKTPTFNTFAMLALVALAILSGAARYLGAGAKLKRAIRDLPQTKIVNASERQIVKIIGPVRAIGEPMRAPVSGRACVGYQVVIFINENKKHEESLVQYRENRNFLVTDETATLAFV